MDGGWWSDWSICTEWWVGKFLWRVPDISRQKAGGLDDSDKDSNKRWVAYYNCPIGLIRWRMYQSIPRPPFPPPPPGIPRAFDSRFAPYSREFDAKLRQPGGAFDHRRNKSQRSHAKAFRHPFIHCDYECSRYLGTRANLIVLFYNFST